MNEHGLGAVPKKAMPEQNDQYTHDAEKLRFEIIEALPDGREWLETPNVRLRGRTPEQAIADSDLLAVRNVFYSIVYVGIY
jgi:hypothetical protein